MSTSRDDRQSPAESTHPERAVMVSPDGTRTVDQVAGAAQGHDPADLIEQPGKVMRIASMTKQLLEEVRGAPLDQAGRTRLAEIHRRSISELADGLAPELVQELERITLPFGDDAPSDAELRIAQAQLVGWLEGLFHGIQAALFSQQMAAQQQLQNMRALPQGEPGQEGSPNQYSESAQRLGNRPGSGNNGTTGQYL
jgi:hypothetical protein